MVDVTEPHLETAREPFLPHSEVTASAPQVPGEALGPGGLLQHCLTPHPAPFCPPCSAKAHSACGFSTQSSHMSVPAARTLEKLTFASYQILFKKKKKKINALTSPPNDVTQQSPVSKAAIRLVT